MRGPDKIKYLYENVDRHGNVRLYFRRPEIRVRLREKPFSEEFWAKYYELLRLYESGGLCRPGASRSLQPSAGSWRWLCVQYYKSAPYKRLDEGTQRTRRGILESTCNERSSASEFFGDMPLARITTKTLRAVRDRKSNFPAAANNRVKCMRAVFKWATDDDLVASNPARDLSKVPTVGGGHHSWTVDEVQAYEARHEVGTRARLAMALMLWTGVRRSDVVLLGRQHVRDGWLRFTQTKNQRRKPMAIEVPLLPELQRVIDASDCGNMTFLMTDQGKPFTANGFGNWFADRCVEAGVPGRAHGLRKAGAATAAENGATTKQLMAIFGWLTMSEAERYTLKAERKRMAGDAMGFLVRKK